jgi:hypothetical protein
MNTRLAVSSALLLSLSALTALPTQAQQTRTALIALISQVQKADYEGNRPALHKLHADLAPFTSDDKLASRTYYWQGFALWRSAINGFNDNTDPKELESDLNQAVADFRASSAKDPAFLDAKIATLSSLGNLMYLNRGYPDRTKDLYAQSGPLLKEAKAADPENPRFLWVMGPIYWNIPAERGGGQDKAFEAYNQGLESIRKRNATPADPLDPTWGEPELLMSLAWSNLNREKPDVATAEQQAQAALKIVPNWHYVKDILLPQIQAAKTPPPAPTKP